MTFSSSTDEQADFSFNNGTEPKTLDPHLATGEPEGRILRSLFEGLMRLDAKTLRPVGGVAETWTVSADETRYEFKLREAARWTDGRPVTAHDFIYSRARGGCCWMEANWMRRIAGVELRASCRWCFRILMPASTHA